MKSILFFLVLSPSLPVFAQLSEQEILDARAEHESSLKDTATTILDSLEYAEFNGLDYFNFNADYQIQARFEKKKGRKFKMPTTTERLPVYRRYGFVYFEIDSIEYQLTVYQNVALSKTPGYEDYLFVPFRDGTTGEQTYGGGRYLDIVIPEGDSVLIDFNLAYNPYCAYSYHYSCPVPPEENRLKVSIEAGEKIPLAH